MEVNLVNGYKAFQAPFSGTRFCDYCHCYQKNELTGGGNPSADPFACVNDNGMWKTTNDLNRDVCVGCIKILYETQSKTSNFTKNNQLINKYY